VQNLARKTCLWPTLEQKTFRQLDVRRNVAMIGLISRYAESERHGVSRQSLNNLVLPKIEIPVIQPSFRKVPYTDQWLNRYLFPRPSNVLAKSTAKVAVC
jgi:hypothetical protein